MRDDNDLLLAGTLPPEPFEDCEEWRPEDAPTDKPKWTTNIQNLAGLEPRDVRWFWEPRVPSRMVTILAGPKGVGKGHLVCQMIAAASTGGLLPGESLDSQVQVPQGHVVYLNAEDPLYESVIPRLKNAGADMKFVDVVSTIQKEGDRFPVVLTLAEQNWPRIESMIEWARPCLFVIDTLFTHSGQRDINSNSEMAPVMSFLSQLSERRDMATLVVHHTVKSPHSRAASDVSGASVISTTSRSVLIAGANEGKSERALFHLESNVGPEAQRIGYTVKPFAWKYANLTLREARFHGPLAGGKVTKAQQAMDAINDLMTHPWKTTKIDAEMESRGYLHQKDDAYRAQGIVSVKIGVPWWRYRTGDSLHEAKIKQLQDEHEKNKEG